MAKKSSLSRFRQERYDAREEVRKRSTEKKGIGKWNTVDSRRINEKEENWQGRGVCSRLTEDRDDKRAKEEVRKESREKNRLRKKSYLD